VKRIPQNNQQIQPMNQYLKKISIFTVLLTCLFTLHGQSLEANFKNPPAESKPKTWMHAMSSNMSKEGLTKDLESIKKVGIGGVLLFNISQGIPNGPVKYNSDLHHEMLKHAAVESERLGLSFGVHNCDGWTSSGGPWITPEMSMKMVVFSETIAQGGKNIELQLAKPTVREGFYRDIAVIAYPSLKSELADVSNKPIISASDKNFDGAVATDSKIDRGTTINKNGDEKPWIQYEYKTPQTIRSVFMVFIPGGGEAELQYSDDGVNFKSVKKLYKVRTGKGEWAINDHFEPITSRFFRLLFSDRITLKEAKLSSTYSLQNIMGRTSMARTEDAQLLPVGTSESAMIINKKSIIDLSKYLDANGLLKAKLPKGNWTIMRFGYTSTGAFNWPASDEGRGLECDKFSKAAVEKHYNSFIKRIVNSSKKLSPNALQYVEIDSYEMGGQNWTDNFETIFKQKKGYDIKRFLPLLAGRFVENANLSEAVLWDFRTICSNLMTENYYGHFTELCHKDGLKTYIEPYGFGPLNDLDVGGKADINMGEFWMKGTGTNIKSAVSASHIYGKEITSAESFTTLPSINWKGNPAMAKLTGDQAWADGINEFMFHRFVHQSNTNVKPGMTMNRWGFHFDRTQTWWENAGADWFKYIARGSYLLRQGVPVSDLLVFVGDGSPSSVFNRNDFEPVIPMGTNFDCVNADVLTNRLKAENGKLILPEGTSYQMLVLKNCDALTLNTLKAIHNFSKAGVTVVGAKPTKPAGYLNSKADIRTFKKLISEIWESPTTYSNFDWQKIRTEKQIAPDFSILGRNDINFTHRKKGDTDIYFFYNPDSVARVFECNFRVSDKIPELWNQMTGETQKVGRFVQKEGITKVWITLEGEGSTFVVFREWSKGVLPLVEINNNLSSAEYSLDANNILIVTASENGNYEGTLSNGTKVLTKVENIPTPIEISGAWNVEFLKKDDYEAHQVFDQLIDWVNSPIDAIQHYSGTAIYRKTFSIDKSKLGDNNKYMLDLGDVKIVANVKLNGRHVGIDWMPPFELDITNFLNDGENTLEIEVTNLWSNRLIGDERYPVKYTFQLEGNFPKKTMPVWFTNNEPIPAGKRTTFCTATFYKATDPLMPSGLKGPVQVKIIKRIVVFSSTFL